LRILFFILIVACANAFGEDPNKEKVTKMYQDIKQDFKDVPELKLNDFDKLEKEIILVDVRPYEERKVSIIPRAISKEEYERKASQFTDKKIAVYCTIGYRSAKYVRKLRKKGVQALNLEGSLLGWVHDGRAVENPAGKSVKKVHVYGRSWNYLPDGFQGEW